MAIRNTTHVLKNSNIVNRPLPSTLLQGEPIVNTADGIVFFSGVTTSTSEWTPAGTGTTANFFEVGSNLYDLRLRNQITQYQGQSGGSLSGKFLSGTTNGFVLADIADIANTSDSYITGATWSPNTLTLKHNLNRPDVNVTIDSFNNVSLYGTSNVNGDLNVTGITNLNGLSYYNNTASSSNEIVNYGLLTSFSQTNDVYVTGNTYNGSTDSSNVVTYDLLYHGSPISGPYSLSGEDTYTTGGTYDNNTALITFNRNDGSSYNVDLSSLDLNDTFVTGGTVNSLGDLELFRNDNVTVTIPKVTYWTSGSTGSFAIKAINNSGLDSTGDRAVSWGNQTLASGVDSTAWGIQTSATTDGSTSSGYQTLASGKFSNAEGTNTVASGNYSHAEGSVTIASGAYSHAEGDGSDASGQASHAEGVMTQSIGKNSHSEGDSTVAYGWAAHSEGELTKANGYSSHAEGGSTIASGSYSHAEGTETISGWRAFTVTSVVSGLITISDNIDYSSEFIGSEVILDGILYSYNTISYSAPDFTIQLDDTTINSGSYVADRTNLSSLLANTVLGNNSHSEGVQTLALSESSHAEGFRTISAGENSHAEGIFTRANAKSSHAEGNGTTSNGYSSHSEGENTITNGYSSHAEGNGLLSKLSKGEAIGDYSHVEGGGTVTFDPFSHAEGLRTFASGDASHTEGYNTLAGAVLFRSGYLLDDLTFVITGEDLTGSISAGRNIVLYSTTGEDLGGGNRSYYIQRVVSNTIYTGDTIITLTQTVPGDYLNSATLYLMGGSSNKFAHAEGSLTLALGVGSHSEGIQTTSLGDYSHSEGNSTISIGGYSHAEGKLTTSSGYGSHAEGKLTTASGYASHAEGQQTTASNYQSHAEGSFTVANGIDSHAEGRWTTASGDQSHTEGYYTTASGNYSHAEGTYTISIGNQSHSEGGNTTAIGNQSHSEGGGTTALGTGSHAEGVGTTASGYASHTEGQSTVASGQASHSEGLNTIAGWRGFNITSIVNGLITIADNIDYSSEFYSNTLILDDYKLYTYNTINYTSPNFTIQLDDTSINTGNVVADLAVLNSTLANSSTFGPYSHAEGQQTKALGFNTHAEGQSTVATLDGSHAEGINTTAAAQYSHAEGNVTKSLGITSHAEGSHTIASGDSSHAEGYQTTSLGLYSHAEGWNTTASGNYSHAEGTNSKATNNSANAQGNTTTASGSYSHAEGTLTISSGNASHAEGIQTTSSGYYSHSEGNQTTALGTGSHAEGYQTITYGNYSHASGIGSIASTAGTFIHSENSVVSGQRSVVLGGQNITGSTNDTVYVPYLNLNYVPTLNNSNTQILSRNSSTGQVEYTALSAFTSLDTFVTGFTYNPSNNTFTISQNQGQPDLTASISSVSGLTVSSLTAGRVVYVGTGGLLTDESGFEYNDGTNLLTVGNINVTNASGTTANIGQGGLVIGSGGSHTTPGIGSLTVHGDLTVFGDTTTISTSELYVEDPQITLNYNPTGNTSSTSIASGIRIQDGDGLGNDVLYTIAQMNTFTGGDVTEYTGPNGYTNRGFMTELNDIIIRNTNSNNGAPDGVRVLAEGDILDGGVY